MKKLLTALLVCVMAVTVATGFKVAAASDGYTWLDTHETNAKKIMYPKKDRANLGVYGYSGTDVILGDWVFPVTTGNVLVPGDDMAIPGAHWGSFGQLYVNTSNEDWYIPRSVEASFVELFIDENGQVYQIDNSYLSFDFGQCEALDGSVIIPTDAATECKQATGDVQLRYIDSSLTGTLSKADIDAEKVADITFADDDLVYVDADGKYTNVATDNSPVMKQQQSVFAADNPLVADGTVLAGDLMYSYVDADDILVYTNQATVDGFEVSPVMENVVGNLWSDGTSNTALDAEYDADANGINAFTNFVPQSAAGQFDIWWDTTANEMAFAKTSWLGHKPHEVHQLTYAELQGGTDGSYYWLSKDKVDGKTVEGITFVDADKLYKDEDGNYTNVADGNTAVMNDDLGFVIPAGHSVLAFEYLDRSNFNNTDYLKSFYTLVNGTDGTAQIVEHDITAPTIKGYNAEENVLLGKVFEYPELSGITASDIGLITDNDDDETPAVTRTTYAFNKDTGEFDTEVTEINTDLAGVEYHIVYTATDTAGNTATATTVVKVMAGYSPIFDGIANKTIGEGTAIDLLDGITAEDGYGNDITDKIIVFKGGLVTTKPLPGIYEILYSVTNANNITTFALATVTVMDTTKPVVEPIEDITIVQGTEFDPESLVIVSDNVDSSFDIIIDDDGFDPEFTGTYNITVDVYDVAGNVASVSYSIEVIAPEETTQSQIDELESELDATKSELDATKSDLEDTKSDLDAANANADDLQSQLDAEKAKNEDLTTKYDELKTQLDELQNSQTDLKKESESEDQNGTIFTAIVALFAVGGLTVGLTSLFKRN
ncbi:hypothetical protein KHQ81_01975 [Mycoplasmatota bacterium]|nr:hypothetical protein KHQ81_01975 [Mycoplasmatota bacterium]